MAWRPGRPAVGSGSAFHSRGQAPELMPKRFHRLLRSVRLPSLWLAIALGLHAPASATEIAASSKRILAIGVIAHDRGPASDHHGIPADPSLPGKTGHKKAAEVSPRRLGFGCSRNQAALAYCALALRAASISSGP